MSLDDWLKLCQILSYVNLIIFFTTGTIFLIIKWIYDVKILKLKYLKEKEPDEWVEEK
ncbi:hypothetical protein J0J36_03190 [Lactococcus sp. LG1074]|jgi:hypothetical protein|uniref:hypothetical protein n=1 Tax=Lactococcus TaxID=1357 RepID=UPI001A900626|nr:MULTISPECIES: hypothetical protein [Lactococcus]MDG6130825.1 hypothetical protein [Lactococcus formosensis]QSR02687.1 hypothetical protein J0J36_03190 [Lactococcus sp. LG1074]